MEKKKKSSKCVFKHGDDGASPGVIYGLGVIGSAVYFISAASGFWMVVLAILKSLVWPAFLVYGLLKYLGM